MLYLLYFLGFILSTFGLIAYIFGLVCVFIDELMSE